MEMIHCESSAKSVAVTLKPCKTVLVRPDKKRGPISHPLARRGLANRESLDSGAPPPASWWAWLRSYEEAGFASAG